jgi:hypothetical protein
VVTFAQALELAAGLDARGWAVVALVVLLAVLRVAAWVARVRRWRRRRALARVPAWGYELPWADGSGVAYVGITTSGGGVAPLVGRGAPRAAARCGPWPGGGDPVRVVGCGAQVGAGEDQGVVPGPAAVEPGGEPSAAPGRLMPICPG